MAGDRVVRAMTEDGAFRVIAAVTTDTAAQALAVQGASGRLGRRLAELITAGVLVRETTAPGRRVQLILRDRVGGRLVADALPDGQNRGIVSPGEHGVDAGVDDDAILQVSYTLPNGALHQGLVQVAAAADISTVLMRYMHESEQIVAMIAVDAAGDGATPIAVGGYLVQVLPEATPPVIEAMTARLTEHESIAGLLAGGAGADELVAALFDGFPHQHLAAAPLRFGCTCSEERILASLASLPPPDRDGMIHAGEPLDIKCDACGARYAITPADLLGFLRRQLAD